MFVPHSNIDPVVIEEIHVFEEPVPIMNLQIAHQSNGESKLIIITDYEVKSIDLHRCQRATTCRYSLHINNNMFRLYISS